LHQIHADDDMRTYRLPTVTQIRPPRPLSLIVEVVALNR